MMSSHALTEYFQSATYLENKRSFAVLRMTVYIVILRSEATKNLM